MTAKEKTSDFTVGFSPFMTSGLFHVLLSGSLDGASDPILPNSTFPAESKETSCHLAEPKSPILTHQFPSTKTLGDFKSLCNMAGVCL